MISSCKLPFSFDAETLQAELKHISPGEWVGHFNSGYYEGQWLGVALRSVGGSPTKLYPDPHALGPIEDTAILERCPHIRDVLSSFDCSIKSARLLRLTAGSTIKEHRDYNLGFEDGEIRLHIPISTSPDVSFFLEGHRVEMREGECWYLNFNLPHKVENRSTTDRVHLVIDCVLNDWLQQVLSTANLATVASASKTRVIDRSIPARGGWKEFHGFVLQDPDLQERLRVTEDRQSFVKLVVSVGPEFGYYFTTPEVEDALHLARQAWIERWVE
jgi:hypothetical protein